MLAGTPTFAVAQTIATFVALTSNFILNNELTYRDRRLKGWSMLWGFIGFCAIGSVGALTNGLASPIGLYSEDPQWWVAGAAGAVMGALWNYAHVEPFQLAHAMTAASSAEAVGQKKRSGFSPR